MVVSRKSLKTEAVPVKELAVETGYMMKHQFMM